MRFTTKLTESENWFNSSTYRTADGFVLGWLIDEAIVAKPRRNASGVCISARRRLSGLWWLRIWLDVAARLQLTITVLNERGKDVKSLRIQFNRFLSDTAAHRCSRGPVIAVPSSPMCMLIRSHYIVWLNFNKFWHRNLHVNCARPQNKLLSAAISLISPAQRVAPKKRANESEVGREEKPSALHNY